MSKLSEKLSQMLWKRGVWLVFRSDKITRSMLSRYGKLKEKPGMP